MRDHELDRLFDRFRRQGDVPALGAVFDATAPELLQVAMSLVHDPGEADDLLQETFLTAIERAGRYDAERRLVPWLLGILVHHAKERRRLRGRELDPARLEARAVPTPEAEARGRELEGELERALAELSARERVVLEAYLRQGKGAAEIASETGAAPGAVRMQIHRGLDRLRRALPAGLALGGAASAQGLSSVRGTVLRAGESAVKSLAPGAGSALGGGTAGVLLANKLLVAGVAAAAVVAGVFWLGSRGSRDALERSEVVRAEPPREASVSGELELAGVPLEASAPVGAPQSSARVAAASTADPDRAGLRGRVVEENGVPVPGLVVGLLQLAETDLLAPLAERAAPLRLLTASARTDARGVFELENATAAALSALAVDLGGERATWRVLDVALVAGITADLGDVVLRATGAVAGRVVDEEGNGVAGARVRIGVLPADTVELGLVHLTAGGAVVNLTQSDRVGAALEVPAWLGELEAKLPFATATTDAHGAFELARVAAGTLTALVDRDGFARLVSAAFEVVPGARVELGELVLERGATLSGRVVDAAGAPAGGAEVRAGLFSRDRELNVFAPIVRCDEAGRFALAGVPSEWPHAVIARRDALAAWTAGRVEAGEFLVELPAEHELVLEVVDAAGRPVRAPQFLLRVDDALEMFGALVTPLVRRAAECTDAAAGRWSLGRLGLGRYFVLVHADGLAQASASITLAEPSPSATRIVMEGARSMSVQVVDSVSGTPVGGATVRVEESPRMPPPAVITQAFSDATGRAVLSLPSSLADSEGEPFFLHVEHPRFAPVLRALDGDSPTVALTNGARLTARVVGPGCADGCMLVLEQRSIQFKLLPRLAAFSSAGSLELDRLAPGEWNWSLHPSWFRGEALSIADPDREYRVRDSGSFELAEGQTFELTIVPEVREDQAPPPPSTEGDASIAGVVRVNGRTAGMLEVNLFPLEGGRSRSVEISDGRFGFEGLAAGRYLLAVSQEGERGFQLDDEVVLFAGEERSVEYDVGSLRAKVRVLDGDGSAVVGAAVELDPSDRESWITNHVETDANGEAHFTLPRPGPYHATARHLERGTGTADLEIAEGTPAEVTITLSVGVPCAGRVVLPPGLESEEHTTNLVIVPREEITLGLVVPQEIRAGSGEFRAVGLEAGAYDVWMMLGPRSLRASLELPDLGSATLELVFEERPVHPDD